MENADVTYGGKLKVLFNGINQDVLDVNYTIEGKTGKVTTTSLLLVADPEIMVMVTFNYQELKKIVGDIDGTMDKKSR